MADSPEKQRAMRKSPFLEWCDEERLKVISGFGVEDLATAELAQWERLGGPAAYCHLEGSQGFVGALAVEIPSGKSLKPIRHMYEEQILILQGRGATQFWNDESKAPITVEWQAGSLFSPPLNVKHQHFNGAAEPVRFVAASNAPLVFNTYKSAEFVFDNSFQFNDRFAGQKDYFSTELRPSDLEEKSVLRPFTEKYPKIDTEEAYRIQLALIDLKKADGAKVVGKKIGLTSKAMQKMLNVDQPYYGHILDGMVLQDAAVFRIGELIQPKIEPEIAFILDRELKGPGVTPVEVLSATRFILPALEIIDSRIEGWKIKLCDTIADNASSGRVVLGNSPKRIDQFDLKLVGMILEKNGDIVQTGAGGAVLGHPAVAVAWLANAVGQFGVSLNAGEIIMPGALCGAADVSAGDLLQASFAGLGSVSVRFV